MEVQIEVKHEEEKKEESIKQLKQTLLPTSLPIDQIGKKRVQKKDEAFEENLLAQYRTQ